METIVLKAFTHVDVFSEQTGLSKPLRVCVPTNYIDIFDHGIFVRLLQPPYTKDDLDTLRSFIQNKETSPPETWPSFQCTFAATSGEYMLELLYYSVIFVYIRVIFLKYFKLI